MVKGSLSEGCGAVSPPRREIHGAKFPVIGNEVNASCSQAVDDDSWFSIRAVS